MRIVIDMQGAQSESRYRGIGRYTIAFAEAVIRNRGEHEVILALSGLFPETIEPIRSTFSGLLPQENMRVWHTPGPVKEGQLRNDASRNVAELLREAFLASLQPDVIHFSSLIEGYVDDVVTSIGRFDQKTPVSVMLFADNHVLDTAPPHWEKRKYEVLKKSAILIFTKDKSISILQTNKPGRNVQQIEVDPCDWDSAARQAIEAWERKSVPNPKQNLIDLIKRNKPRLAYVSPLPPEKTGIADYSAELILSLSEYYDIDFVVSQSAVDVSPSINPDRVRDVAWLRANAGQIERVLYHIGNSPYHAHMLTLLAEIPGVVVLHDFYLGHMMAWLEQAGTSHFLTHALFDTHGYIAIQAHNQSNNREDVKLQYPANGYILQNAVGIIVHSEHCKELARRWQYTKLINDWRVIPLLRMPSHSIDHSSARMQLGFDEHDILVCSFGFLGETKLNHRLLECWLKSALASDKQCHLVFVGEICCNSYGLDLLNTIDQSDCKRRIHITGFASPDLYKQYLAATDIAVQLRTQGRGETSAAVLDCMNYGLSVIVNAHGSMAELDHDAVCMLPDDFDDAALVDALEQLRRLPEKRMRLGEQARRRILEHHAPEACARQYAEAIEAFHARTTNGLPALIQKLSEEISPSALDCDLMPLVAALSRNHPIPSLTKRLYLDITATAHNDLQTGIERVARALTLELLEAPPQGYRVEPVYLSHENGTWVYRSARRYTLGLLACPADGFDDEIIEAQAGDVLLGLDLSGDRLVNAEQNGLFRKLRNQGVLVYATVYDLLPVRLPDVFPPGADLIHRRWLEAISNFDGAICISKVVADDLRFWQEEEGFTFKQRRSYSIDWFRLGADVCNTAPSRGLPPKTNETLSNLKVRPSFLMVGTIEPRKGYLQTIDSFEQLWKEGVDANLVLVGREGWKGLPEAMRRDITQTVQRLCNHTELNKRLFWLEGISDEYLEKIYASCTCLIAASYDEGFGLPLIEAAQHRLPIIARDIPVFREVVGAHAFYFNANTPNDLAKSIKDWLKRYQKNVHPKSDSISWLTWKESAVMLSHSIINMKKQSFRKQG